MPQKKYKKPLTFNKFQALIVQSGKDSALHSLLYVARKLGEVETLISLESLPHENLIKVQKDLSQLYDQLFENTGIQKVAISEGAGIGGDPS
jgi:hypothetical protein